MQEKSTLMVLLTAMQTDISFARRSAYAIFYLSNFKTEVSAYYGTYL